MSFKPYYLLLHLCVLLKVETSVIRPFQIPQDWDRSQVHLNEREGKKHKELNKEMTENKTKQLKAAAAPSFSPTSFLFSFSNLTLKFIPRHIVISLQYCTTSKEVIDAARGLFS